MATTLFGNNVLLALTTNYWSLSSEFKPLLHTWTLGVEEQFDILFPWLCLLAFRIRVAALPVVIAGIASVSLLLSVLGARWHPDAAFYLLHTRAWELLFGALCALHAGRRMRPGNDLAAASGLALILGAVFAYDEALRYPSYLAAVPVLGTGLVLLWAREGTLVARALSWPPLVQVGLMSYSAYLWHQPVFAFARVNRTEEPTPLIYTALVAVTLGLAYASWRFVEQPLRDRRRGSRRLVFAGAAGTGAVIVGLGYAIHASNGLPQRFFEPAAGQEQGMYIGYNMRIHELSQDAFGAEGKRRILVVGTSTARDFVNMILETKDVSDLEIVYREDLYPCWGEAPTGAHDRLLRQANAIFVGDDYYAPGCLDRLARPGGPARDRSFVIGPKHFGYNLNVYAHLPKEARTAARVRVLPSVVDRNEWLRATVPEQNYIDILAAMSADGAHLPLFDGRGYMLSVDRLHLTRSGARVFGARVLSDARLDFLD